MRVKLTSGDLSRKIWLHSGEKCWWETAMYFCRIWMACCRSWEAAGKQKESSKLADTSTTPHLKVGVLHAWGAE